MTKQMWEKQQENFFKHDEKKSKDLPFWKRWLALKTLSIFGWFAWMEGVTHKTRRFRECRK
jgi:hypothetical protein